MRFKDFRMKDGSRQFCELEATSGPKTLMKHLLTLHGTEIADYLPGRGGSSEDSWIDFTFRGHFFTVNGQYGDWWFFVQDPACPDDILLAVVNHCVTIFPATKWMTSGPVNQSEIQGPRSASDDD